MRILLAWCERRFVTLALAFFYCQPAAALANPAINENFYGAAVIGDQAWIVGYYGTILHSTDRGLTWEWQTSATHSALFNVRFVDQSRGWINGSYGTVLHTTDGGKHWRAQPTGTAEHLLGSFWLDKSHGWLVGSRGTTLRTENGGSSWLSSPVSGDFTFNGVWFADSARGTLVGEFGVIFQTQDGGKNWTKQKSPVEVAFSSGESQNLFAVLFTAPRKGFAVGIDGLIIKTVDGSRWDILRDRRSIDGRSGANHLFNVALSGDTLWAIGERGTLLKSNVDGDRWQQANVQTPRLSLNGIAFGKDGFGLVVGNRGVVLRSEDGGRSWKRIKINLQSPPKGPTRDP